jgi:hypothetical protein
LVSHMVDGGISILKYVDDTIFFIYGAWFSEVRKKWSWFWVFWATIWFEN